MPSTSCVGRRVLEQEAARAGLQRVVDVLVEVVGREHEHARRVLRGDLARGGDAVELGHADVHQHDVGLEGARRCGSPRGRWTPRRRPRGRRGSRARAGSPARTSDWSSTIRTRMLMRAPIGSRAWTRKPPLGRPPDVERAAVERDALAHADQPVAGAVAGAPPPFGPRPSSAISTSTARAVVAHDDPRARGARRAWRCWPAPPARSGTRRGRRPPGSGAGSPSTRSSTGRPRVAGALRRARPRARGSAAAPSLRPRRPTSAAELGQRLARRPPRSASAHCAARSGSRSTMPVGAARPGSRSR